MIRQILQHLIRDMPDTHLERCAVRDQRSHMFPDLFHDRVSLVAIVDLGQSRLLPYETVDVPHMHESIAMRSRHQRIDKRYDMPGGFYGSLADIHARAQGAEPVLVRR